MDGTTLSVNRFAIGLNDDSSFPYWWTVKVLLVPIATDGSLILCVILLFMAAEVVIKIRKRKRQDIDQIIQS